MYRRSFTNGRAHWHCSFHGLRLFRNVWYVSIFIEQRSQHQVHVHFTVHESRFPTYNYVKSPWKSHHHFRTLHAFIHDAVFRAQRPGAFHFPLFFMEIAHLNTLGLSGFMYCAVMYIIMEPIRRTLRKIHLSTSSTKLLAATIHLELFSISFSSSVFFSSLPFCSLHALFLYYFRRCDSDFFFINATRADTVRAQSNIMFFHHFRLALVLSPFTQCGWAQKRQPPTREEDNWNIGYTVCVICRCCRHCHRITSNYFFFLHSIHTVSLTRNSIWIFDCLLFSMLLLFEISPF